MAVLELEIYNKIIEVGKEAVSALKENDLVRFEEYAEKGWNLFPEPKNNWNQGYNYAKMVFNGAFNNGKLELAKLWLDRLIENNDNLHFFDEESQFLAGKYYFEIGNFEKAYKLWREVVRGSGGSNHFRYFEGEDKKYLEFYKKEKKLRDS